MFPRKLVTWSYNVLKTFRFNPGFQTDDEAVANFVVRQREFKEVLDALSSPDEDHHRVLVVAPRGAGKTTLLRRVLAEVRADLFLRETWIPIVLGEESYSATSPGEFLLECLYHLAQDDNHRSLGPKHHHAMEIDDEAELQSFCLEALTRISSDANKRLLIMVENFHIILRDQIGKHAGDLIDLLARGELFGVLATSVKSKGDEDTVEFRGEFRYIYLKPLSLSECQKLWEALTNRNVEQSRIRPLQILTGGSPRLLHILAAFMKTPSLHDLMENLSFLIDQNTEYFKSQLDALPSQERKVFVALLEAWDPSSAKQIASSARVTINVASAMLNRLADRGAVVKQPGGGRVVLYNAAERLFNIYYLMRRRSHPSSRVRALVAFMTQYYDRDELVDTTTLLVLEACGVAPSRRSDYHNAFSAILLDQPEPIRSEILKRTPPDFLQSLRSDPSVAHHASLQRDRSDDSEFEEKLARARAQISDDNIVEAKALLREAMELQPGDFRPWVSFAFAEMADRNPDGAIESGKRAVELADENPVPHMVLGMILRQLDQNDDAERELRAALALDPAISLALTELAKIEHDRENLDEARDLFERALTQAPLYGSAASRYAFILSRKGDSGRAERILRDALAEDKDDEPARHALVNLLFEDDRVEEAAEVLRIAAESGGDDAPWFDYGAFLLNVLKQPERAVETIERALSNNIQEPRLYTLLARATQKAGGTSKQILAIADRLAQTHGKTEEVLVAEGQIRQRASDLAGAEAAFRAASFAPDASGLPSVLLGRLLSGIMGRTSDAAEAFETAHRVDGAVHCGPLKELAELRVHQGNDPEAAVLLEQALAINPQCECSLVLQAEIAGRSGDRNVAREICNRALEINPANVAALTVLARISDERDAAELIERAIAVDAGDPQALLARSRLHDRKITQRIKDAKDALSKDRRLIDAHIELAALYGREGDRPRVVRHLSAAFQGVGMRMEVIPALVGCTIQLLAQGFLTEIEALLSSDLASSVEPLAVAVLKYSGKKPVVAKEVEEVADDILKRIYAATRTAPQEPDLLSL
ncbi:tetratricopeptide repeat protein [Mesorhizobium sp. B1-1-5]|nr:tetratricopeptide repeat protein [Mesorhizobium sp. B1-1-5]